MNEDQRLYIEFIERKEQLEVMLYLAKKYQQKLEICIDQIKAMQKELDSINSTIKKKRYN